jgi:tetratricopeptide (TPR) repeat protein
MGQYMEAQKRYDQSLLLHCTIGDRAGEALTRHSLGKVQRTLGNYPAALQLFKEALAINQAVGDRRGGAHTLYQLGFLHTRLAEYDTAITLLADALIVLKELDDSWALGDALTFYGWTLYERGQPRQAKKLFEEALKIQRNTQQEVKMMESIAHLGRVALALNDLSLADTCARHALNFIESKGTQGIEHPAVVYLICYHILHNDQKFEQARSILIQGQQYIMAQVAQIDDLALQQTYLNNVPENQQIQALVLAEK